MKRIPFWIAGTLLTTLSAPPSAPVSANSSQLEARMIISAYDFAHIGPKTLTQSEQLVTRIFALAGVDAQWITGSLSDVKTLVNDLTATPSGRCTAPLPAVLQVQILSHAPNGFHRKGSGIRCRAQARVCRSPYLRTAWRW